MFQFNQKIRCVVQRLADIRVSVWVSTRLATFSDFCEPPSKNISGQSIEHCRLVQRFHCEFSKQCVTPIDQIIDIFHDYSFFITAGAEPSDGMGIERVAAICFQRICICEGFSECVGTQKFFLEHAILPHSIWPSVGASWVEDVVIPTLRRRKPLLTV